MFTHLFFQHSKRFIWLAAVFVLLSQSATGLPAAASGTGILRGSVSTSPTSDDLTAYGNFDWAIWGIANHGTSTTLYPDDNKSGGAGFIGILTDINPCGAPLRGIGQFPITPHTFSWTDGSVRTFATDVYAGLQHDALTTPGCGFSLTVPAFPIGRRLRVYVTTHQGVSRLTATLSDNSAVPYSDTSVPAGVNEPGLYTIDYASSEVFVAPVTLTVQWVMETPTDDYNNAAIYAVTLLDAQGITQVTIDQITDLVDAGELTRGQGNALTKKLTHAIDSINAHSFDTAKHQLQAFIHQVNDFISQGILSPEEGQPLIDAVNTVIDFLRV